MGFEITDMSPVFGLRAWPAGKTHLAQSLAHAAAAGAIAGSVDIGLGYTANIGPAAKETAEMSFLIAPRRDFDGAVCVRVGIDDAGGFKGKHDAKRTVEPAREVLAF